MMIRALKGLVFKFTALGLLATTVVLFPDMAFAQDLQQSVTSLKQGIGEIPTIISGFAYMLGAGMMIAGAMKLRSHAENPTSEPLQKGLVRLGVGAVIAAMPAFATWANTTLANEGQSLQYQPLDSIN